MAVLLGLLDPEDKGTMIFLYQELHIVELHLQSPHHFARQPSAQIPQILVLLPLSLLQPLHKQNTGTSTIVMAETH
jgi:hypothetical protein